MTSVYHRLDQVVGPILDQRVGLGKGGLVTRGITWRNNRESENLRSLGRCPGWLL